MKESKALEQHCHILNVEGISKELREFRVSPSYAKILLQHDIEKETGQIKEKNDFINIVAFQLQAGLVVLQFINYILDGYGVESIWRGVVCIIAFIIYPVQIILSLIAYWSKFQAMWKKTLLITLGEIQ